MTTIGENYHKILWPSAYVMSALDRLPLLTRAYPELASLYRHIFSEDRIRVGAIPPDLPFSREIKNDAKAPMFLVPHKVDLPLTIVVTTRNDDHVEQMHERTQAFIDSTYFLASKYRIIVEVILVEWNPPKDREPLEKTFVYERQHQWVSLVIITVPHYIHSHYELSSDLPLYQMIAKNAGIRRARGTFILCTNIDILISEELFTYITKRPKKGQIIRSNRWDIDRKILNLDSIELMLVKAEDYCFQINYSNGVLPKGDHTEFTISYGDRFTGLEQLHTWACGDFQLLHRDDWARLRGYSELDAYSLHIDSLFALTCFYANLKEINLGNHAPHFHIDHTLGTPVKSDTYVINEKKALFHLSYLTLLCCGLEMKKNNDFYIYNDDHWGLAGFDLPATVVSSADWDPPNLKYTKTSSKQTQASMCPRSSFATDKEAAIHASTWISEAILAVANYLNESQPKKEFWIWGAGERGKLMANWLEEAGIPLTGIIHNIETTESATKTGAKSKRFSEVREIGNKFILVCSVFADDIRWDLEPAGYAEGRDYMVMI